MLRPNSIRLALPLSDSKMAAVVFGLGNSFKFGQSQSVWRIGVSRREQRARARRFEQLIVDLNIAHGVERADVLRGDRFDHNIFEREEGEFFAGQTRYNRPVNAFRRIQIHVPFAEFIAAVICAALRMLPRCVGRLERGQAASAQISRVFETCFRDGSSDSTIGSLNFTS